MSAVKRICSDICELYIIFKYIKYNKFRYYCYLSMTSIHINILRRMKMNTRGEELIDSYEHEQEDSHSFKGHILDIYAYRTDDGKIEIRFDDIHYHKPKIE